MHPREVFPTEPQSNKEKKRDLGEWQWMNVLNDECDECDECD
jgi:hypothetical protein